MSTYKMWWNGAWVEMASVIPADPLGGQPPVPTTDAVATGSSIRSSFSLTASATPHSPGSWVEVDPSLSTDSDYVHIFMNTATNTTATDTSTLIEIGTGAAGAETVWATIPVGYGDSYAKYMIPGRIAAGTRVAIRYRSAVASKATGNIIVTFGRVHAGADLGTPATFGVNTATSKGVTLTAPGSLNTKSAWTQIVASTSVDLVALLVAVQGAGGTNMNGSGVLVDIGIGASGAESVLIPDIYLFGGAAELYTPRMLTTFGVDVPSGSRLAARYARANAGNAIDLTLIGAPPA